MPCPHLVNRIPPTPLASRFFARIPCVFGGGERPRPYFSCVKCHCPRVGLTQLRIFLVRDQASPLGGEPRCLFRDALRGTYTIEPLRHDRVIEPIRPAWPEQLDQVVGVPRSLATSKRRELVPPQPGVIRVPRQAATRLATSAAVSEVADQPGALVSVKAFSDMLRDVFADVSRYALAVGFDRQKLVPTEPVTRRCYSPESPLRPQGRVRAPVVASLECLEIGTASDISPQDDEQVKMHPPGLLTLRNHHSAHVTALQDARVETVKPAVGFLQRQDFIREGEREKPQVLNPVVPRQRHDLEGQDEGAPLVPARQFVDFPGLRVGIVKASFV